MPLNDFYTYRIIESGENNLEAEIEIDPKHPVYDGHFPEQPVTPGVILIEMVRKILSNHVDKKLMMRSAKELKFMSPVIPSIDKEVFLNVSFEKKEEAYKVVCVFSGKDKTFTKLKGEFCEI